MKSCQSCNYDNADSMSFCLQCGAPLTNEPPATISLSGSETQSLHGVPTNFNSSGEVKTFVNRKSNFVPNFQPPERPQTDFATNFQSTERPKTNTKLFLIIGGLVSLVILGIGAAASIIAYNQFSSKPGIVPLATTPSPADGKSPNPAVSPNLTPTPQTSFTPPTEATKRGTFTVYANGGWQVSEIDIVPREKFTVTAVGLIDVTDVKTHITPAGLNDKKSIARRLYPEYPTGALLLRTHYPDGHLGNVLPVTAGVYENFPDELGRLEFCVNDKNPESNGGQFTVTVTMTSVPKTKK